MNVKNISLDNDIEGRSILYEENAPSSNLLQWLILLGGFVLGMFYFFTFFFSLIEKTEKYINPLFILIFYSLIMWDFFSMHKSAVVITKKTGFFRNVIMTTTYPGEFLQRIRRKMG